MASLSRVCIRCRILSMSRRKLFAIGLLNVTLFYALYHNYFGVVRSDGEPGRVNVDKHYRTTPPKRAANEESKRVLDKHRIDTQNHGFCGSVREPPSADLTDVFKWYPVDDDSKDTFVYSAYFDDRYEPPAIKIFGICSGWVDESQPRKYCQVWYPGAQEPEVISAKYDIIPETHDKRYAPSIHICYLSRKESPVAVSLVSAMCAQPTHHLKVHTRSEAAVETQHTVCVSPLNFHFDEVHHFVEFVEMNRLFGADRFVLYNHTTGTTLDKYLKTYIDDHIVDVLPWKIPVQTEVYPPNPTIESQIHYFGQVAALNDCLYRYMYRSKYIVYLDLDEVLVPRKNTSWSGMLDNQERLRIISNRSSGSVPGAYLVQNTFFRIDWPDDEEAAKDRDLVELRLRTQLKLVREEKIWSWYMRSKFFVVPPRVETVGIHYAFSFVDNFKFVHEELNERTALLHHLRDWGDEEGPPIRVKDPHLTMYRDQLVRRVRARHRRVQTT